MAKATASKNLESPLASLRPRVLPRAELGQLFGLLTGQQLLVSGIKQFSRAARLNPCGAQLFALCLFAFLQILRRLLFLFGFQFGGNRFGLLIAGAAFLRFVLLSLAMAHGRLRLGNRPGEIRDVHNLFILLLVSVSTHCNPPIKVNICGGPLAALKALESRGVRAIDHA